MSKYRIERVACEDGFFCTRIRGTSDDFIDAIAMVEDGRTQEEADFKMEFRLQHMIETGEMAKEILELFKDYNPKKQLAIGSTVKITDRELVYYGKVGKIVAFDTDWDRPIKVKFEFDPNPCFYFARELEVLEF